MTDSVYRFTALRTSGKVTEGRLIIDEGARDKNRSLIQAWRSTARWWRIHGRARRLPTRTHRSETARPRCSGASPAS